MTGPEQRGSLAQSLRLVRRQIEVPCTVDLEYTTNSLHAYVELHGYDVVAGDQVTVQNPPTEVRFGEKIVVDRRATVVCGSIFDTLLAKLQGYRELTELYEVSFSNGRVA